MKHTESRQIITLYQWYLLKYPFMKKNWLRIEQGGKRSAREAHYMQREGLLPGVADILITSRAGMHPALWLEVKTDKGRLQDSQKAFLLNQAEMGFAAGAAFGLGACMQMIDDYFAREYDQEAMSRWLRGDSKGKPYK